MGGVLDAAFGSWGTTFVSAGLVVSVLGAYLAWTLMAAEVLFVAARDGDMPRFLRTTNEHDAPVPALLMSTALAQAVLLLTLASERAFDFALELTGALVLIPYLLAAAYGVRLLRRDRSPRGQLVVATLATLYTAWLLFAAGIDHLLVVFVVYAPASVLFVLTRREQGRRWFSPASASCSPSPCWARPRASSRCSRD
ncbi:APC family permease [Cellulomonas sp.]|uniref:APC family permease n=1 Tax=Cellulomonas sp. TaxID=40001 RepID=UPI00338E776D